MRDNLRQVLVTGAGGFIGGHIVRECLLQGCYVHALIHHHVPEQLKQLEHESKLTLWCGDICDAAVMENLFADLPQLDAVIHCAAKASDVGRKREFIAANYRAVQTMGRLALQHGVGRLVFISTTDVYGLRDFNGESETELSFDEKARNPYPKYKILAEKWLTANLPPERYCIIRPAAVWGPDDLTLTKRAKDFLSWSPFIIHFGRWHGHNRWPLAHVKNVAKAAYLGAFSPRAQGRAFQVLDPRHTTIDEFYRMVAAMYFPHKKFRTITLPLWCGQVIGTISTGLSNLLNLKRPLWDPTLYALYSVSRNLDFSPQSFLDLLTAEQTPAATLLDES